MKIQNSDYSFLTHYLSKALFMGIGLSKLLNEVKQSIWISVILGSLIGILFLYIIKRIDIHDIDKLSTFKSIVLILLLFSMLLLGFTEIINLISSIYLSEANRFFLTLPIIISLIYLNTKNESCLFNTLSIIIIICFVLFFIAFFTLINKVDILNFLPLFKIPFNKVLLGSLQFALLTVTPNILYTFINTNNITNYKNHLIRNYLISNLFLFSTIMIVLGVLGPNLIKIFKYPEYFVLKKISILGFINNIENIISLIWILNLYIYIAVTNFYLNKLCNKYLKYNYLYPILTIIIIYLASTYIFDNLIILLLSYSKIYYIISIILILFLIININYIFKKKHTN